MKSTVKAITRMLGIDINALLEGISAWSIRMTYGENGLKDLVARLREIIPDISRQEESEKDVFDAYIELKRRTLQAFQCRLMLQMLKSRAQNVATVVDIGDSAGTHMLYLKALAGENLRLDTVSVNLDPRAIEKIRQRGLDGVLCRAEDLDLGDRKIDVFTSFEMVEHLHDPAIFFRRLAVRSECDRMLITVPYLKKSRVGLHHVRHRSSGPIFAEDEHIFELSPEDWSLLLLHSGWNVVSSHIYYQYPRRWLLVSNALAWFWRKTDFEGFWGAVLEKDRTVSDRYQDWDDRPR
ncbi:MAG: methyltransferase domain-containing protein [Syntrophorhabdaceae bacterium]|nr:methyltransferase domain-containing protein [Syntrophorhabdaceae bacterium]